VGEGADVHCMPVLHDEGCEKTIRAPHAPLTWALALAFVRVAAREHSRLWLGKPPPVVRELSALWERADAAARTVQRRWRRSIRRPPHAARVTP
jgi:hypothetical protein